MAAMSKRALFTNVFGTLGYISCLFQWLFVALLYLPLILDNEQIKHFLLPEKSQPTQTVTSMGPASPLLIGFAIIFTVFMIVLTVVMLLRAPISIARKGRAVTTKAATTMIPLVTHQHLSTSKKRILTNRLVKVIKLSLVLLPFLLSFISTITATTLPFDVVIMASSVLAIGSLLWFTAQYISARLLQVKLDQLV